MVLRMLPFIALLYASSAVADATKIGFWDTQRKGANQQNSQHRPEWYVAAGDLGLDYVRILPDAWPAEHRDFLIGNADSFQDINETDLALLIEALDEAERNGVKVVLAMLSLPGSRWRQLNEGEDDTRLWKDRKYHLQAFQFWKQLAARLKAHPADRGLQPPQRTAPGQSLRFRCARRELRPVVRAHPRHAGRPQPVQPGNGRRNPLSRCGHPHSPRRLVLRIAPGIHVQPTCRRPADLVRLPQSRPLGNGHLPHQPGQVRVPGSRAQVAERTNGVLDAPSASRRKLLAVEEFARTHNIPANRIIASEFWYDRRLEGAAAYLGDLIRIYNERNWHWAFYAFRGSGSWTGLDYEIPPGHKMGWRYWQAVEQGEDPEPLKPRGPNRLWDVLRREFAD